MMLFLNTCSGKATGEPVLLRYHHPQPKHYRFHRRGRWGTQRWCLTRPTRPTRPT